MKKKIKRTEPVVDVESPSEDVGDISDVEDYISRNQQLWNYYFDEINFKYFINDK